jgi:predicted methyltransferase
MKKLFTLLALSASITLSAPLVSAQAAYTIPEGTPAHIVRGVQAADRPAEDVARDASRMPAEVLTLAGLEEGDKVAEISSFGQYYTRMLAAAVGPNGRVDQFDMPYMESIANGARTAQGRAFPETHPNTTYALVHYNDIELAGDLDAVYNMLYYHDLQPQMVDTAAMNAKIFAALKPGGVYVIEDHKAEDGSGWRDGGTIHRIEKETIVEEVTAAGFELATDSDILENPDDPRTAMVFEQGTRGATDRALLVFKKPE